MLVSAYLLMRIIIIYECVAMLHHYSAMIVNKNHSHLGCTNIVHHRSTLAHTMPRVITNIAACLRTLISPSLGKTPSQLRWLAVAILITLHSLWYDSLTYIL
jgi:hypothetical protein